MFEGFERRRVTAGEVEIALVVGGSGPPLLLLHGYPQTHVIWHKIAPRLAEEYTVVASDLRGYGDSGKPRGQPDHANYAKRAMAADQVEMMSGLGFGDFFVAGHDRGGRVVHRMCLDHPGRIRKAAVLDIVPTATIFAATDMEIAMGYYHWFFLAQPFDLPERLIGADPAYYLRRKLAAWGAEAGAFSAAAMAEYVRCFSDPDAIHGSCEDYRAAATVDLEHDAADGETKSDVPLLALWGRRGLMERHFDVLETWRARFNRVEGRALDCGHFLPEEEPEETFSALRAFFAAA